MSPDMNDEANVLQVKAGSCRIGWLQFKLLFKLGVVVKIPTPYVSYGPPNSGTRYTGPARRRKSPQEVDSPASPVASTLARLPKRDRRRRELASGLG